MSVKRRLEKLERKLSPSPKLCVIRDGFAFYEGRRYPEAEWEQTIKYDVGFTDHGIILRVVRDMQSGSRVKG